MTEYAKFRRVAIVGAGLIGTSFGAAIEKAQPDISITIFDKPEVRQKMRGSGFRWEFRADLRDAVRESDLIYVALPVVMATEVLAEISMHCMPSALVTDAGSTKAVICRMAKAVFHDGARFLGGHPIAGRELTGFEYATADLFCGRRYALVSDNGKEIRDDSRVRSFVELLGAIGAEPVWIGADEHDRALATLSQMPQMIAVALAGAIFRDIGENGVPLSLSGNGLRDMLRTAASPYEIWRDICATNGENIAHSLDKVSEAIDFVRQHLTSADLEMKFHDANDLHRMLRKLAGRADENPSHAQGAEDRVTANG